MHTWVYVGICLKKLLFLMLSMLDSIKKKEVDQKEITRTWLAGQRSCTLVIPKDFAKEYGLDEPSHVILEKKHEGILIKKLEI
jgi:hypothetical protein